MSWGRINNNPQPKYIICQHVVMCQKRAGSGSGILRHDHEKAGHLYRSITEGISGD